MVKLVYLDGDKAKVIRGACHDEGEFFKIINDKGQEIIIGKRFVISIKDVDND